MAKKQIMKTVTITVTEKTKGATIDVHLDDCYPYEAVGLLRHALKIIENVETP